MGRALLLLRPVTSCSARLRCGSASVDVRDRLALEHASALGKPPWRPAARPGRGALSWYSAGRCGLRREVALGTVAREGIVELAQDGATERRLAGARRAV